VLLITPGPAVLYILARSLDQGRLAGLVSVLSIEVGNSVHVLAAAFGLAALLQTSPLAFALVRYSGAAYLVYLGARRLIKAPGTQAASAGQACHLGRIFFQGVLVAVLNPKTALFFLAFLPQFVNLALGDLTKQFLFLGGLFVSMAICTDSMYAILASTAGKWLAGNPRFIQVERYGVAGVYILLGLSAALR
jgi:threonine/homoserine/homoserine lactone efflux protein